MIWNPIHRYDSYLVVLTADSTIRGYDLRDSFTVPDQTITLTAENVPGQYGLLGINNFDPISICFGISNDHHGQFSLFVLSRSGDIFVLCPFVPNKFIMTGKEIEDLFNAAISAEFKYRQVGGSNSTVEKHYKTQLVWIADLWRQESLNIIETRSSKDGTTLEKYFALERQATFATPDLQGPFIFSQYPEECYANEGVDIDVLSHGPLTVFCVTFSDGSALLCAQTASVDLNWAASEVPLNLQLNVVEFISLAGQESCCHVYKPKIIASLAFFIMTEHFVHRIDISSWAEPVAEFIHQENFEMAQKCLDDKFSRSEISRLYDVEVGNDGPFVGLSVYLDREEETYISIAYRNCVKRLHWSDISMFIDELYVSESAQSTNTFSPTKLEHDFSSIKLYPLFSDSSTQRLSKESELEALQKFYSTEFSKLHAVGVKMQESFANQRKEIYRQSKLAYELPPQLLLPLSNRKTIHQTVDRQVLLMTRLDTLRAKLSKLQKKDSFTQRDFAAQKKKWKAVIERRTFSDIEEVKKKIDDAISCGKEIIDGYNARDAKKKESSDNDLAAHSNMVLATEINNYFAERWCKYSNSPVVRIRLEDKTLNEGNKPVSSSSVTTRALGICFERNSKIYGLIKAGSPLPIRKIITVESDRKSLVLPILMYGSRDNFATVSHIPELSIKNFDLILDGKFNVRIALEVNSKGVLKVSRLDFSSKDDSILLEEVQLGFRQRNEEPLMENRVVDLLGSQKNDKNNSILENSSASYDSSEPLEIASVGFTNSALEELLEGIKNFAI